MGTRWLNENAERLGFRTCSPSCSVAMNQGQGKTLSVDLFMMLNTMLKAYLSWQKTQGATENCKSHSSHQRAT
jgi:hypothetical protein